MKFHHLLAATLFTLLSSCVGESEKEETANNEKNDFIAPVTEDYQHIIAESTNDYPLILRSEMDIEILDRNIMEIVIGLDGSFTIEGDSADWDDLDEEVRMFFEINRRLSADQYSKLKNDKYYKGVSYPFFTRFTRESYQSYINQLTKMAETDAKAGLYLQRHVRRFKAFDAVEDQELPYISPLAVIRYVHPDDYPQEKLLEFETKLAQIIYSLRGDLAIDKFKTNYRNIRARVGADGDARRQLLYLQEMYPAYLLRLKESETEVLEPALEPMPVPTPAPSEDIEEEPLVPVR